MVKALIVEQFSGDLRGHNKLDPIYLLESGTRVYPDYLEQVLLPNVLFHNKNGKQIDCSFPDPNGHLYMVPLPQPRLRLLGYSDLVPKVGTNSKDLFILNTSQLVDGTVNNNSVIEAVDGFLETHASEFEPPG